MSGELVGRLVSDPEARKLRDADWRFLATIAEQQHHEGDCVPLSNEQLQAMTDRSRNAVQNRVKRLEAAGWLLVTPGGGREIANAYRINPARFSSPNGRKGPPQGGRNRQQKGSTSGWAVSTLKGPDFDAKQPTSGWAPSVSVSLPSFPEQPPTLAGDQFADALGGLGPFPWTPAVLAAVAACVGAGHSTTTVRGYLIRNVHPDRCHDVAAVVAQVLHQMPPPQARAAPPLPRHEPEPESPDEVAERRARTDAAHAEFVAARARLGKVSS